MLSRGVNLFVILPFAQLFEELLLEVFEDFFVTLVIRAASEIDLNLVQL